MVAGKKHRRIPYQWRLFVPLFVISWAILLSLAAWQYNREVKYRRALVSQQLKMINSRIARAVRHDNWAIVDIYKDYLREYYDTDSLFNDLRLTIYDQDWNPVDSMGRAIILSEDEKVLMDSTMFERKPIVDYKGYNNFYLGRRFDTADGLYAVVSSLPNDRKMEEYLVSKSYDIWFVVFALALGITIVAFIMTRHLARNIELLRDFAERSANDPWFEPVADFAHDELGDIAQEIVHLYNERAQARKRNELEHQLALNAIEQKSRQKRQLTNNINHELKTPIGVIKGYLDTIVETPDMDEATRQHFIIKAREHANRLVNLIADVSAITRLEDGENQINTEQLDFHEIVYMFANDASESGVLGHFKMEVDIPIVADIKGNNNLLVGMLLNLTKNAVNYSGGDKLKVEYRDENDNFYRFAFYDNGHGVPEASIPHLFDRFYRIDSGRTRKAGGTGLGLAIVFNTIKAHGGEIVARNREEGGLEFEFTLRKWNTT